MNFEKESERTITTIAAAAAAKKKTVCNNRISKFFFLCLPFVVYCFFRPCSCHFLPDGVQ